MATIKILDAQSFVSREASSLNLAEFRVTIGGCGFGPVRWLFRKFRFKLALLEGFYIKGPHFSSSKPSNKPFNPSSKQTHYLHNLPLKCVPSPQSSPSSRVPCSYPSKQCLKARRHLKPRRCLKPKRRKPKLRLNLAGNARPIKDCSSSNNRPEATHSTANS